MRPTALILTTVHAADDTRIRERLIRTLQPHFNIVYATRAPGPTDSTGVRTLTFNGGRLSRNIQAFTACFRIRWDVLILHDPETIPLGLVARAFKRGSVVFDVHEDLPAQVVSKEWIAGWAKPLMRTISRWLYGLAERFLTITLAEPGYQGLFSTEHPVFPNYPRSESWPTPPQVRSQDVIYVGDVQPARGLPEAVQACGRVDAGLMVAGHSTAEFAAELLELAERAGTKLQLIGRVDHRTALSLIAASRVGISPLRNVANYEHSLPTKTLEYLGMGTPVVATDLPGTREVIGELNAVWLVPPGDANAMAEAIRLALAEPSLAAAIAQSSSVRDRYSWPESVIIVFYLRLVQTSEGSGPTK